MTRMASLTPAERLLWSLGIGAACEIDLEAVAWTRGITVRSRPLKGCEARIFGDGSRAIVSVNSASSAERRRFSLAHEIGHWEMHRGKVLFCRSDDIGGDRGASAIERMANQYAAELLMPSYILNPIAERKPLTFAIIDQVAQEFRVSRTAAAIRLVDKADKPAMLVCYSQTKREWFHKSPSWPAELWLRGELDTRSRAFDAQFGRKAESRVMLKVPADAWFDRAVAGLYEIRESVVSGGSGTTLSLIEIDRIHRR